MLLGALTVTLIVVVWLRVPDVPVIVTLNVPEGAVALAVSVNVLESVVELGLKEARTPLGCPAADRPTEPVNPLIGVTTIVVVPPTPPAVIVSLDTDAERLKSGLVGAAGHWLTRFATFTLPIPVAKSQPAPAP
jgi:hypothetical protein